ncbi:MAG: RDD family protein [Bacteroidales bacterium]|nr:RDD family protein [Prevotella sp.]MCI6644046.1 RDD family protein [Bacteroidales bacterium]
MAQSNIITGQYVQISQTPASVGDRIVAQAIDWLAQGIYLYSLLYLFTNYVEGTYESQLSSIIVYVVILLPALLYSLLCEIFNHGQSIGKKLMKTRVVKTDGSTPGIGTCLLRWILFIADGPALSFIGILVMLINRNNQRLGDIAAGTMVIKLNSYSRIQVSLDEFAHLSRSYRPVYPQASDLSLEQVNLISKTLELDEHDPRVHALAQKVQETLQIKTPRERSDETFLWRMVRDYQYCALEEI